MRLFTVSYHSDWILLSLCVNCVYLQISTLVDDDNMPCYSCFHELWVELLITIMTTRHKLAAYAKARETKIGCKECVKKLVGVDCQPEWWEAFLFLVPDSWFTCSWASTWNMMQGFSSSLTRATAYDPVEPVLPSTATVQSIDRIRGPYNPSKLRFIKKGLSWEEFQEILKEQGI